ncbi:MAG: hypothetical protein ACLFNQ_04205 [Spirochaetaceae bacterium]
MTAKWLLFSIGGLILIGAGVSVVGEAIILKQGAESVGDWFWMGTLGLVILNSGVSVFGQGVVTRARMLKD